MADDTFFYDPQSRAQIARRALHKAGADDDGVMVPWEAEPRALIKAAPRAAKAIDEDLTEDRSDA